MMGNTAITKNALASAFTLLVERLLCVKAKALVVLVVTSLTNIVKHRQTPLTCLPVPQLEQLVPPPEPEVCEVV